MEIAVSREKRGGSDVIQRQIAKVQRKAEHRKQQVDGGSAQLGVGDHLVTFEARRRVGKDEFQSGQEMGNQDEDAVLRGGGGGGREKFKPNDASLCVHGMILEFRRGRGRRRRRRQKNLESQ